MTSGAWAGGESPADAFSAAHTADVLTDVSRAPARGLVRSQRGEGHRQRQGVDGVVI